MPVAATANRRATTTSMIIFLYSLYVLAPKISRKSAAAAAAVIALSDITNDGVDASSIPLERHDETTISTNYDSWQLSHNIDPVNNPKNSPEEDAKTDDDYYDTNDDTDDAQEWEDDTDSYFSSEAHDHASEGNIVALSQIASDESKKHTLLSQDGNGWQPLHEAASEGHEDVINLLLEHGADINAQTEIDGQLLGGSPLYYALMYFDEEHDFIAFLRDHGAVVIEPDEF